jgi:hypothetical protein
LKRECPSPPLGEACELASRVGNERDPKRPHPNGVPPFDLPEREVKDCGPRQSDRNMLTPPLEWKQDIHRLLAIAGLLHVGQLAAPAI